MDRREIVSLTLLVSIAVCCFGCSKEQAHATIEPRAESASTAAAIDAALAPTPDAAPKRDALHTQSLKGREPVTLPDIGLSVVISQSSHKMRAPLAMVSILVTQGEQKAEVSWRIESNEIDGAWLPLQGRRYDDETSSYVEEEIPGWLVRLDSIDASSANASPRNITVSFKRAP